MGNCKLLFCLLTVILLFSCGSSSNKSAGESVNNAEVIMNKPTEQGSIGSMDIPVPEFFWMLQPWKKGTLATMDGNARFAEIVFSGESSFRVRPLVDFPKNRIDKSLVVAHEGNLCIVNSSWRFYVADVAEKRTKEYMPQGGWKWTEMSPVVLDAENQIIVFKYYVSSDYEDEPNSQPRYNIIYDMKNDKELYKSPDAGEALAFYFPINTETFLAINIAKNNAQSEYVFYNWKTKEITRNDLTKQITAVAGQSTSMTIGKNRNINMEERYFFGDILGKKIKITWDEKYEDVKVIPLDYLIPKGKRFDDIIFSSDYKWATTLVGGYSGMFGESLYKRAFFHMDELYPNGISMPIFNEEYEEYYSARGHFVEHPVHGWCYADEIWSKATGTRKQFLRLYKMKDVDDEITRILLERADARLKQ